ncbi:molybdopterin biosynthesis protein MoeB [Paenibacillus nasutitermitis]|uniref:Molybdopterin biosynthesis protein MoeB n=2 Tax=Paenibacillus nasutitermitis TaxID=1652958 RepID=A0A916Z4Q1_9BACL|nr:molybdopterin biosynthesis protein MoeB [Paenibacillus nasutitermitis]
MIGERSAAVVGLGALGSVSAQHLVRSGIGRIRLIDRDVLEWSNLQRQVLYTEDDVQRMLPKAQAAAERLRSINSSVSIDPVVADLTSSNAEQLLEGFDLIIDGSDNFSVRYLINDVSLKRSIPWIYGGVVGASGMTMSFIPGKTPCFRCLFPAPPAAGSVDTCDTAGVISPAVDLIASIQAAEALKWLSGNSDAMQRTLFQVDLWHHRYISLDVSKSKRDDCPACSKDQYDYLDDREDGVSAVSLCGRNTIQIAPAKGTRIQLGALAARLRSAGDVEQNQFLIRFRRDKEMTAILFPDGRALIQGTEDPIVAKRIYNEIYGI